jgi:hypothetical protein
MTGLVFEKHSYGDTKLEADSASMSTLSIVGESDDDDYMYPPSPCAIDLMDHVASGSCPTGEAIELAIAQAREHGLVSDDLQTTCRHVQYWDSVYCEVASQPLELSPPPASFATPLAGAPEVPVPKAHEQEQLKDRSMSTESMAITPCKNPLLRWADEDFAESEGVELGCATLMVRNIACRYSKEDVIGFLAELGFDGAYDFFYLPLNASRRSNLGYFFINFRNEADSNRCRECLQGKCLGTSQTQKRCDVSMAKVQGAKSILEHFHRKAVTRSSHAPIFLG